MFFFIGGIQPKTVILDETPRMCPSCGLYQARLKRLDHYLALFFIPLFRVKKGQPFLECQSCGAISPESGQVSFGTQEMPSHTCPYCGKPLEPSYLYCPFCGRKI
ncbi:MAG TPA: zinc ribbon domain-containing protein [Desulfobacterales bacterium]|nr:zinc ribbon domain-containing protein [Desulfobacterales bacterium]